MREIEFNFAVAGEARCQIEEAANQMNTEVLCGFLEIMQEISEAWNGEAGKQFQEIARREAEKMKLTVQLLKSADTYIQDAILTARQIEEKTKEIAEFRTY